MCSVSLRCWMFVAHYITVRQTESNNNRNNWGHGERERWKEAEVVKAVCSEQAVSLTSGNFSESWKLLRAQVAVQDLNPVVPPTSGMTTLWAPSLGLQSLCTPWPLAKWNKSSCSPELPVTSAQQTQKLQLCRRDLFQCIWCTSGSKGVS